MPSFLSEGNPLSAMSSVVNKFNPFDLISDTESSHDEANRKQKSVPQTQQKTEDAKTTSKPVSQQQVIKQPLHSQDPVKSPLQNPEHAAQQQPSVKSTAQQPGSPKLSTHQPGPPMQTRQTQGPSKQTQQQGSPKRTPSQQGPQKTIPQQPGSPKQSPQQQRSLKTTSPQQSSPKPTMQGQGSVQSTPLHQGPQKMTPQQQGVQKSTPPPQQPLEPTPQMQQPPKAASKEPQKTTFQQQGPQKSAAQKTGPLQTMPGKQGPTKPKSQPSDAKKPAGEHGKSPSVVPDRTPQTASQSTADLKKTMCPICTTTELLLHTPEKANYSTCTRCQTTVCSLCGFNPNPDITEVKEWLCLNCQMQRAMNMEMSSTPVGKPQPSQPRQPTVPTVQKAKQPVQTSTAGEKKVQEHAEKKADMQKTEHRKPAEAKKAPQLIKQQSLLQSPPLKAKQSIPDSKVEHAPQHKDKKEPEHTGPVDQKPLDTQTQAKPGVTDALGHETAKVISEPHAPLVLQKETQRTADGPSVAQMKQGDQMSVQSSAMRPVQEQHGKDDFKAGMQSVPGSKGDILHGPSKEPTQKVAGTLRDVTVSGGAKPYANDLPKGQKGTEPPKFGPSQISSQASPKPQEQPRRFSLNLGSMTETPKHQPLTPQETVTGKLFGFGASFFNQASSFISQTTQSAAQTPSSVAAAAKQPTPTGSPKTAPRAPAKEAVPVTPSPKQTPAKTEGKPQTAAKPIPATIGKPTTLATEGPHIAPSKDEGGKGPVDKVKQLPKVVDECKELPKAQQTETSLVATISTCPLCKTLLNIGSKDPPNYNTCTECKSIVCNLCGFNPTPHLIEVKEWLCLNCQTQRALAGQLGDIDKVQPAQPASPKVPPKDGPSAPEQPAFKDQVPIIQRVMSVTELFSSKELPQDQMAGADKFQKTDPLQEIQEVKKQDQKLIHDMLTKSASMEKTTHEKTIDTGQPVTKLGMKTAFSYERETLSMLDQKQVLIKDQQTAAVTEDQSIVVTKMGEGIADKCDQVPSKSEIMQVEQDKKSTEDIRPATQKTKRPDQIETGIEKAVSEKEDDKSDASSAQQQKSPQGLSDTGYSSDGISGSLGEIPSFIPTDEKDLLKEPSKTDSVYQESSPTSPSDLAKLESTVLSILEAQANNIASETSGKSKDIYNAYGEQMKDHHRPRTLPITPESCSSDEELEDIQEEDEDALEDEGLEITTHRKSHRGSIDSSEDLSERQRHDSVDDSSESEHSPFPQRRRKASVGSSSSDDSKREDSQGSGDDEDFIRKQIIEMSADEDASGSEEEDYIRNQIKEISGRERSKTDDGKVKGKGSGVKYRRFTRKNIPCYDDDQGRRHSWHDEDEETFDESPDPKYRETKSQDNEELSVTSGGGLRRFKTIELNSTVENTYTEEPEKKLTTLYFDEEPELEMESLTDSPEDRSRGEGSSSLHASSFTPGTSPTSVSSLDEDSDSSPSHKKASDESKQRKARHRAHGPVLPTIEDSSEEEELREEEELLREQEKLRELDQQQRKSSSKKSKKDKDELRAQRRRERPKTPPSNLSPIEDASPTEELRQAAEMEELHRSSCSEYSPSIESEPEGFEISPDKIKEVRKVYKLPTSVSLYSPTDEKPFSIFIDDVIDDQKPLKSAEEVYEEMIAKAKQHQGQKDTDDVFEKEPLYGGMLIEDYIYESLVEDTYNGTLESTFLETEQEMHSELFQDLKQTYSCSKQLFDDISRKGEHLPFYHTQPSDLTLYTQENESYQYVVQERHAVITVDDTISTIKEEKQLLDADAAYEELMKRQQTALTPGTSPTQPTLGLESHSVVPSTDAVCLDDSKSETPFSLTDVICKDSITMSLGGPATNTTLSIPDVKVTQHFTTEDVEDEYISEYARESVETSEPDISPSSESEEFIMIDGTQSIKPITSEISTTERNIPDKDSSLGTVVDLTSDTMAEDTSAKAASLNMLKHANQEDIAQSKSKESESTTPFVPFVVTVTEKSIPIVSESAVAFDIVTAVDASDLYTPTTLSMSHVIISLPQDVDATKESDMTVAQDSISKSECIDSRSFSTSDYAELHTVLETSVSGRSNISVTEEYAAHKIPEIPPSSATQPVIFSTVFTTESAVITCAATKPTSPPSITSKVFSFFRSSSSEYKDSQIQPVSSQPPLPPPPPPPPPLPPPVLPKPVIYPRKKLPVSASTTTSTVAAGAVMDITPPVRTPVTSASKVSSVTPPPIPPKPASIPAGLMFSHRPGDPVKPPVAPKPSHLPVSAHKPTESHSKPHISTSAMTLNLISAECSLISPTSPTSPHSNKSSPRLSRPCQETYVVITLPSEPGTPTDGITSQTSFSQTFISDSKQYISQRFPPTTDFVQPDDTLQHVDVIDYDRFVTGTHTSSVPYAYESALPSTPAYATQVIPTEVARTTVSVHDCLQNRELASSGLSITSEHPATEYKPQEEGKRHYPVDVIDLRTLSKFDEDLTDRGIDLSASLVEAKRQTVTSESNGRQITAVPQTIVNLSTGALPLTSLPVVAQTVTLVTCSTTLTYSTVTTTTVDLGHAMSEPLQLTASKYADLKTHSTYSAGESFADKEIREEIPINLSFDTAMHALSTISSTMPVTCAPVYVTDGWNALSSSSGTLQNGAVDLSTTKVHRAVTKLDDSLGVLTTVLEDEEKPVDLTAGRKAVCCDVVYKLPFGTSCTTLQPATSLPEDRFGYRDDHYQYGRSGSYGYRGLGHMKSSMSDTNLADAGLHLYKTKNALDYSLGLPEAAVDLTSGKVTAGEAMDYSSKTTGLYPEMRQVISGIGSTAPQYSLSRMVPSLGSQYGTGSVLRSSNGVVYSSVAAPIPSTFAITTQPGSIFNTTVQDLGTLYTSDTVCSLSSLQQSQPLPRPFDFLATVAHEKETISTSPDASLHTVTLDTIATIESGVMPSFTVVSEAYLNSTTEAISISEENKQQQLDMEREFLELEKLKQQRLAEELEWERQEIQRFREQETLIVQKRLEELQSMKQQILMQQEEERQAQYMMQQETFAQQQIHLEQIQQLQQQLQQQLEEQKNCHLYQYGYDASATSSPQTSTEQVIFDAQFTAGENGQYWAGECVTTTTSAVLGIEMPANHTWYTVQPDGVTPYISRAGMPTSLSEMSLKEADMREESQLKKRCSMPRLRDQYEELDNHDDGEQRSYKKIVDSGIQTDDEDETERSYSPRRRRTKKSVDTSVQTDDEDQEDWDIPSRTRRRSRVSKYADSSAEADKAKHFSKVSSIAVQTVSEMSVQTDSFGTIRTPSIRARMDAKVEIIKHISAPEKTYKKESLGCQTEVDSDTQSPPYFSATSPQKEKKRPTPLEIGYSSHLRADSSLQVVPSPPKSPKVLYSPISPLSPTNTVETVFVSYEKSNSGESSPQKALTSEVPKIPPPSPKSMKVIQRSLSDPKPLSPTAEESSRTHFQYSDGYTSKSSQSGTASGTQKKIKRTLPNPPPEDLSASGQSAYSSGSISRRRVCRPNTMARAKILQDIDRELDLVERESSKLRKKQAELDEEEKEIDAKLRYLEMGINRRKEALLQEREKRERAYLQGVAEERDYMSDSEVSNIRGTRIEGQHGLERPRTAPQSEFNQFLPPQTQAEPQYAPPTSPYTQYQYPTHTSQTPAQYSQQSHYLQQSLYHQQITPYQAHPTFQSGHTYASPMPSSQTQQSTYQHPSQMMMIQQKPRQTTIADLEPKITTNYEVVRNQTLMMAPSSTDNTYSHLGSKYSTLDLRLGLDERSSMAGSPMSSISGDSFYADIDHHTPRNYVLIDDIGELTKGSPSLSTAYSMNEKDLKTDHLLHTAESRRNAEVSDFLGSLQTSSRVHSYGKPEDDSMEEPYELKLLKHQIKQEFRRGTEGLEQLGGLSHYYHGDSGFRHFPKSEKYSISRLTLEKQAAKQLPPSLLYQKQVKHKKSLIDPKMSKFSPIQENRDLEPDYNSYMSSSTSSLTGISSRARLLQDDITFGLRKNISEQQKFSGSALVPSLGQTLAPALSPTMRSVLPEEADKPYSGGTRSRPSSRPSSVYGLDLTIKRDSSSTSLRLKPQENEPVDVPYGHSTPPLRTKPCSLPISQSRGRIPIVAQNSEEESPLSPVGQPMGMARAAAGPLPPISADSRDQFGSSHSLPEVQQHMREESRSRAYDRDIAFIMDDFQHAMSDSEAYHLRREETDWFDKPRESHLENGHGFDGKLADKFSHGKQCHQPQGEIGGKPVHYSFPHSRVRLLKDPKDHTVSGNGLGIRIVGGKEIPGNSREIGAYIAKILPGGNAEQTGKLAEGMQVLEWNGIPLTGKTYEEVQSIIGQPNGEAEICVRLDLNMLSDFENPQHLELHEPSKLGEKQRSPGVDPKQLAAELQKVSQQQAPSSTSSISEKGCHVHSGTTSAASSAVPSPGQPGSPSVSKKRHSTKTGEATKTPSYPITGDIQLQINYDKQLGNLNIHVLQARNLTPRDNNGYSDPFVKVYLLPGRGQVMVVQNASAEYKRRTKYVQKSLNPEWNQTVIYKNITMEQLKKKTLEVTVWDYDRFSSNDFLGEVLIDLSNTTNIDNTMRWYPLKEQSDTIEHGRSHSGQSREQSPKTSVIKSRSHGIFPDPSKDMQVPTIEKSHSSPGSSKSSSEGHLRSHGPSRSQSKSSVTQTHLEDAGAAIAAAEAAVQQLRLQPTKTTTATTTQRTTESSVSTISSVSSTGSGYSVDSEGSNTSGDNSIIPALRLGKTVANGQDLIKQPGLGPAETEGKTQVMGEIKIALKKEMKTDGEQLTVEILQCRNITYKFKSPDHLPDLYVKLYIINVSSQKRVIKKKTRVCRHDREPSFNETFRFSLSPAGHSLQILLVSNGGKFMKKTLIGEAYIWLDKVDLRKRIVNWHKLLVTSSQSH
ncbi:protein piccolo isoform X2 [Protopterus annectens]|uniref:protein piccolo isoform X2 n=1 Tax=Protopterus annectens TaxID=7888 RepID=UPI001CFAE74E|nr:protein piccolo isoform X2 [Protopterus annectens]